MAEFITDLELIKRLAQEHEDEDIDFRTYLKGYLSWGEKRLDALVQEIAEEVTRAIDCTSCGNCCRLMVIGVTGSDVSRLARRCAVTVKDFESRYVTINGPTEKMITESPCPFLEANLCSVYDDRPRDCREFPHLHKTGFRSRTLGVLGELSICPIVYNTWELLKQELDFKRRRRKMRY
jgi:uncharacterized protein